jgi:hypothetical protein
MNFLESLFIYFLNWHHLLQIDGVKEHVDSMNLIVIIFTYLNRLVLMGNESCLRSVADKINGSLKGVVAVEVVGVDMEEEREGHFADAVDKACMVLGNLDAFVHCYTYEGTLICL